MGGMKCLRRGEGNVCSIIENTGVWQFHTERVDWTNQFLMYNEQIAMQWGNHKLTEAGIRSISSIPLILEYGDQRIKRETQAGQIIRLNEELSVVE